MVRVYNIYLLIKIIMGISINSGRNSCELEFARFLIEKLAIAVLLVTFIVEIWRILASGKRTIN